MNGDTIKKIAVVVIAALTISSFIVPCAYFCFIEADLLVTAILFVIMLVFTVGMIYVSKERLEEINGGQDDDVKHY